MWLVVGLGNPGFRYAGDRHNAGFHVIHALCEKWGGTLKKSPFQCLMCEVALPKIDVLLIQPQTYMNLSGNSVLPLVHNYNINVDNVLVIHDDLELPLGRLKLKSGGSDGGHRGLLSISEMLQTRNYPRLRFGIGRPVEVEISIVDYVLSPPNQDEETMWWASVERAAEAVSCCCQEGLVQTMNRWNRRLAALDAEGEQIT